MKSIGTYLTIAAISLAFTAGASAAGITDEAYKTRKDEISSTYKNDKKDCESKSGTARDICLVQAEGKMNVAKAKLEEQRNPTAENQYEAKVAQAEADYNVAKERCKVNSGDAEDACEEAAESGFEAAKAKAKMRLGGETD